MKHLKISDRKTRRARQAVKYWTKKKMKNATPIPLRRMPKEMIEDEGGETTGPTRIVQPVAPRDKSRLAAQTLEVSDMHAVPFRYVGKLFMREGNANYVGSAWVIGERAIFTAAHCLLDDNGTFFDDVIFRPKYRNGNSPDVFGVVQMVVDSRYMPTPGGNPDLRYDLGIAILEDNISDLTGIPGYVVNPISEISVGSKVTGVGYPAASPFDGSKMFQSTGEVIRDSGAGTTTERFFGAENDMTGGCSGGPWFRNNLAVGLNSFVFVGENPPVMHSPYFGQGFADLIQWAEDNGGGTEEDDDSDNVDENESLRGRLLTVAEEIAGVANDLTEMAEQA